MNQIQVTFILKGYLMWPSPGKKKIHEMTLAEGLTIEDAIASLNVPKEQVNMAMKDGKRVEMNTTLVQGDRIEIVPILAGG